MRSLTVKYDQTLRECCAILGLDEPNEAPPLQPLERIRTEADLCSRGVTW